VMEMGSGWPGQVIMYPAASLEAVRKGMVVEAETVAGTAQTRMEPRQTAKVTE
jgi:hypothetical protein